MCSLSWIPPAESRSLCQWQTKRQLLLPPFNNRFRMAFSSNNSGYRWSLRTLRTIIPLRAPSWNGMARNSCRSSGLGLEIVVSFMTILLSFERSTHSNKHLAQLIPFQIKMLERHPHGFSHPPSIRPYFIAHNSRADQVWFPSLSKIAMLRPFPKSLLLPASSQVAGNLLENRLCRDLGNRPGRPHLVPPPSRKFSHSILLRTRRFQKCRSLLSWPKLVLMRTHFLRRLLRLRTLLLSPFQVR